MPIFQDVRMEWAGKEYVLPAKRVLRTIAQIEEVITLSELERDRIMGRMRLVKLASAYSVALRSAGAVLSDEEVYAGMFDGEGLGERALHAVHGLLAMMIPPSAIAAAKSKEPSEGESAPTERA